MKVFNEPIPFKGGQRYLQVGIYDGRIPIYTTNDVPREAVAFMGVSELGKVSIAFSDEAYEILNKSGKPRKYIETICERGINHGFDSFDEIPRTKGELEVLGFLREHGIESELDRAAPLL